MTIKISRLPKVMDRTGLSRSGVYEKIKAGEFPPPIKLGPRARGWTNTSIDDWINARIKASQKGGEI